MRAVLLALLLAPACASGKRIHKQGSRQLAVRGSGGIAIPDSVGFRGDGDSDNVGIDATLHYFFLDDFSIGGSLGYRYYNQQESASALETQIVLRSFFWQTDEFGVSLDVWFGGSFSSSAVPTGGTSSNFLFSFGPAFEWRFSERTSLITGYYLSHISNGKGSVPENPAQNSHQFWIGIAWDW